MEPVSIVEASGFLRPAVARHTLLVPAVVPAGVDRLDLRVTFEPSRVNGIRNLVTLAVFEPDGTCRGAAHRHEPAQVVTVADRGSTVGFVDGPVVAGEWTVAIDVHCVVPSDVGGVRYTFAVTGSLGAEPIADASLISSIPPRGTVAPAEPPVVIDTIRDGGPRWLKGDLHIHSDHSDGRWTAEAIVDHVRRFSLDFVALTDHNTVSGTRHLREALRAAGLATVVIPGMELTTFFGHANVLGVEDWVDWRTVPPGSDVVPVGDAEGVEVGEDDHALTYTVHRPTRTMAETASAVQSQGGLFVVNHPRSAGYPMCTGCHWDFDDAPSYTNVIEVMNGDWPRRQNDDAMTLWDKWLALGWRVPATAGSDAHAAPLHADRVGFTYVHAIPDTAGILASVKAGRSFLSRGPHLAWQSPGPGEAVPRNAAEVAIEVRGAPAGSELRLVRDGQAVDMRPAPTDDTVVTYALRSRPAEGTWFRVHLVRAGTTELLAITNPVWVGR